MGRGYRTKPIMQSSTSSTSSGPKPIYANSTGCFNGDQCDLNDICQVLPTLKELYNAVVELRDVIDQLYPAIESYAPVVAAMTARTVVPPAFYVRIIWARQHPGQKFLNTARDITELKLIYADNGLDWTTDPFLSRE